MPNPFIADPEAVLDYSFDWTQWLAEGETITSYVVTVAAGITSVIDSETDGVVTVWLTGGTNGTRYRIECLVNTSEGRTDERSFYVKVQEQ